MKNKLLFILAIFVISSVVLMPEKAFAIKKLAFPAQVQDIVKKGEKTKEDVERYMSMGLDIMNGKVLQIEGQCTGVAQGEGGGSKFKCPEGVAIYKTYMPNGIAGGVENMTNQLVSGNFDFSNWQDTMGISGAIDAVKSDVSSPLDELKEFKQQFQDIGDIEQDIATLEKLSDDYSKAALKAKKTKLAAIEQELANANAILATGTLSEDDRDYVAQYIANLEAQKTVILQLDADQIEMSDEEKQELEQLKETYGQPDDKLKDYGEKISALRDQLADIQDKVSPDAMMSQYTNKVDETINKLLPFMSTADTKDLYTEYMERLFIPSDKIINPENQQKVDDERRKEYYEALKNLFNVTIENQKTIMNINDKMEIMRKATTMADGILGAKNMDVGIAIQLAKTAAVYLDTQIAKMRYLVTYDMQNWSNMYQTYNDSQDLEEFNLGNYDFETIKKKQQYKGLAKEALSFGGSVF